MAYSVETVIEIWNDETGEHIEVGPDRDGLDMIEIRQCSRDGKIESRFGPFTVDVAEHLAVALRQAVAWNGDAK